MEVFGVVFSGVEFLFYFLPIALIGYFCILRGRKARNIFLTVISLLFYAWGEPTFVLVMLLSIFLNYCFGLLIDKNREKPKAARLVLTLMCVTNVGLLGVFKYLMFLMKSVNSVFSLNLPVPGIALPIGISFFTFQAMSYVIDVYRGKGEVQKHFMNVCLYISFFPQLIAGPIVRYQTVADEIMDRKETWDDFTEGARRFIIGLCKKVILANNLAVIVDMLFPLSSATGQSVMSAWLAACCYLMQVYYDFGGYSDMAIGLGRMFGFHFLENFDFPFISRSVTEFWRRWHISLGSWFRDYVFFPLGGSRVKTKLRLAFNMFVVWSLTGLWHGADWTYVLWGVAFAVILIIEKLTGLAKWMEKHKIGHFYAMLIVVTVTILIRSTDIASAFDFLKTMFLLNGAPVYNATVGFMLTKNLSVIIMSVVCGIPFNRMIRSRLSGRAEKVYELLAGITLLVLMVIAISFVTTGSYNPFIYFNF